MKLFVIATCLAVSVSIGYANYDYEYYNKYNEWNQAPSSNGYNYNDYNTFSTAPEEPSFLKRVGKAILGWGKSSVPERRSGILTGVRNSISRVSRQFGGGEALMPVILAVGLIIAKGLMDLAAATSAPGPKGDTGAAGAVGPQGAAPENLYCTGTSPTCITGTPTCAAPGDELPTCSNVAGVSDCSTLGMRSFTDLVSGAQFTTTLPGAQDACTCNAATGTLNNCNRPECTAANVAPTCPNGVAAQCSNYDSTTVAANRPTPVCSTLGAPRTHLNAAIALPNLVANGGLCTAASALTTCPEIVAPTCPAANNIGNCAVGQLTCDNRPNLAPICSTRPGTGAIATAAGATPGTALCTQATINMCAMCTTNAVTVATCAAGQSVVCSNYHSSSLIRPAPACMTDNDFNTLNTALALPTTDTCSNGTPQCPAIAAPSCTAAAADGSSNAQCSGAFGNADGLDRGVLSCTGVAPGQPPVCSVVPGAARLDGTGGCTNGAINFACGDIIPAGCATEMANPATCPPGHTRTCAGRIGGQIPICSRQVGIAEVAGAACAAFIPPVCPNPVG